MRSVGCQTKLRQLWAVLAPDLALFRRSLSRLVSVTGASAAALATETASALVTLGSVSTAVTCPSLPGACRFRRTGAGTADFPLFPGQAGVTPEGKTRAAWD